MVNAGLWASNGVWNRYVHGLGHPAGRVDQRVGSKSYFYQVENLSLLLGLFALLHWDVNRPTVCCKLNFWRGICSSWVLFFFLWSVGLVGSGQENEPIRALVLKPCSIHPELVFAANNCFRRILNVCWREHIKPVLYAYYRNTLPLLSIITADQKRIIFLLKNNVQR